MPKAGQTIKPLVQLGKRADACWQWLGPIGATGHGHKTFHGVSMPAHRWLWQQLFGVIPDGLVVFHTCGKKDCVNPHHLQVGYQATANRGAAHCTLLPSDVADIRRHRDGRMRHTARLLAERYGISAQTVRDIWRRNSWQPPAPNHGPRKPASEASA